MFFILSKTVALLLLPSNILILCGLAGVVFLMTRWRRLGVWLVAASLVVMALVSFLPVGAFLLSTLESRFPPWQGKDAPDGIIVLGGAIDPVASSVHGSTMVTSDAGRLLAMATLARRYPQARIVYTAGDASILGGSLAEAPFVTPLLDNLGLPRERVMIEPKARNTYENAVFVKALVQPKSGERWLLVTSAYHMPRSVGSFRAAGFPVEAYPANWRVLPGLRNGFSRQLSTGLAILDLATHEWFGLIVYRLTGKTDALLPSP
jgi:uncharacterized SAM-binding protein YcdF (DUF218 family)